VTLDPLAGYVVVLAGTDAEAGRALLRCGALLAVVSADRTVVAELEETAATEPTSMLLAFHADPSDVATWERLSAHIEQRVGPVDAVLCTAETAGAVHTTFDDDMRRRGHGAVITLTVGDDPVSLLREQLHRTR
jgi:NAD(P)-dependent dehydrogenase (short-subunit alcohol dehydrogenase family)